MRVQPFIHDATNTLTYVVWDPETLDAVVIDPVLDFDDRSVSVSERSADQVLGFCRDRGLNVHWVLETHVHADHLSAQRILAPKLGARTAISARIGEVQATFADLLDLDIDTDGSQWDHLLQDGVAIQAGSLSILPIATPGHTPACTTLQIGDALFTGDTLFMPDFGTGRCDFPGGSAEQLFDSIRKLYDLPDETRVFVGHDYGPGGRELAWETTIGACKTDNKQLKADTDRSEFVTWRTERDATLSPPRLIFQSLTVNAAAGELPPEADNGRRYFKAPIGVFD